MDDNLMRDTLTGLVKRFHDASRNLRRLYGQHGGEIFETHRAIDAYQRHLTELHDVETRLRQLDCVLIAMYLRLEHDLCTVSAFVEPPNEDNQGRDLLKVRADIRAHIDIEASRRRDTFR